MMISDNEVILVELFALSGGGGETPSGLANSKISKDNKTDDWKAQIKYNLSIGWNNYNEILNFGM